MTKKTTKLPVLTEVQTMLYNTLVNKSVGLTVSEIEALTGLSFRISTSDNKTRVLHQRSLDALKRKGLVRIAGFKSSNHYNGIGSSIYQIVNPTAKVIKFKAVA